MCKEFVFEEQARDQARLKQSLFLSEEERVRCGRCNRDITLEPQFDGDEEFNEKLCCNCTIELNKLSAHNRPILASLGCKVERY